MKILYVNENRHEGILVAAENPENENIHIIPRRLERLQGKQYTDTYFSRIYPDHQFNLFYRSKLSKQIEDIIKYEKPDIIHLITGDDYLRLFGLTLSRFRKYNFIVTLHWCRRSFLRDIARRIIAQIAKGIIFHTVNAPKYYDKSGNIKSKFIVLPPELDVERIDKITAKKELNLPINRKTFSFVGMIEEYKGIEILLKSIQYITQEVTIYIAGKRGKYDEKYIRSFDVNPKVKLMLKLEYLSDIEFTHTVCASDFVVLPYKKEFDATSGPMTEAVRCGVPVIASNCNNLGLLVDKYKLGKTFDPENPEELARTINESVQRDFLITDKYKEYQNRLSVNSYREEQQNFYKYIMNEA